MTLDLDPERRLALAYVSASARPAVEALWRLDAAFAAVLSAGRDPMVSRIKLAWWREALEGLDGGDPPAQPVLEDLADHVLPAGVTGAALAEMEEGWAHLLEPGTLAMTDLDAYAAGRGGRLFAISARLLGREDMKAAAAGERWALVDLARRSSVRAEAETAFAAAAARPPVLRWPVVLRPLGMLDALARRDLERGIDALERQGSPRRMMRMLGHRMTGS